MALVSVTGKRIRYDREQDDIRVDSDAGSDSETKGNADDDDDDDIQTPALFTSLMTSTGLPLPPAVPTLPAPSAMDSLRASLMAALPSDFSFGELTAELDALNAAQIDELAALIKRNAEAIANNTNPVAELPHQSGLSLTLHSAIVAAFERRYRLPVNQRRMAETRRAKAKSARAVKKFEQRNDRTTARLVATKARARNRKKAKY